MACVTETWTQGESQQLIDFTDKSGYDVIKRDRTSGRGGGVAIMYKKSHLEMIKCKIPALPYEVIAAVGRRTRQRRKIVVVTAYVSPGLLAADNKLFIDYVCDVVMILKQKYRVAT